MRLLVAEDDPKLLKSLLHIFKTDKYVVEGVSNGREALNYALTGEFDGLVLDIMMPELDGVQVLKELRGKNINTPALFLTAKTEVYQRVEGLDAGADDYLPKPFSTSELLARVRAMLRRKENYLPDLLSYGELVLNRSTYDLSYKDRKCFLSGKEYQIMEMLMQRPNFIVTTEQFMTNIWGWETAAEISVVWVHISNIRKKLQKILAPVDIRFVRNVGYSLEKKNDL